MSCDEYIKDGNDEYKFVGNFAFLERLEDKGYELTQLFSDMSSGSIKLGQVSDVVTASLTELNGEPVKETDKREIVTSIIERYGLQEAAMIARAMMVYAMVGSVKKSQIDKEEQIIGITSTIIGSESMTLKKRGLLWMAHWISSGLLAWLIFNASNQLT
jgi:hypothetical protein